MICLQVFLAACLLLLAPMMARADLASVKAEAKPEKRAKKALENADLALKTAQEAYRNGKLKESQAAFEEVGDSVELANDSLRQTGKNPIKSPKHFKDAEIKTRELLRKLDDFRQEMNVEDRGVLDKIEPSVRKVHDELLLGIMGTKRD